MDDPFTILGIEPRFGLDVRALEQRHRDLSRVLHPDRHTEAGPAERRAAIEKAAAVNEAFRTLKNPLTRASALLARAGRVIAEDARADQALLADILERREALEEARSLAGDARTQHVAALRRDVEKSIERAEATITKTFDGGTEADLDAAFRALVELRYLYRFVEEADAIDEG